MYLNEVHDLLLFIEGTCRDDVVDGDGRHLGDMRERVSHAEIPRLLEPGPEDEEQEVSGRLWRIHNLPVVRWVGTARA